MYVCNMAHESLKRAFQSHSLRNGKMLHRNLIIIITIQMNQIVLFHPARVYAIPIRISTQLENVV